MRASCLAFCISRLLGESIWRRNSTSKGAASKRPATASGCGGAGPSAASPLLPDAQRHRLRRGSWYPTPRRSQRRSTPFFSTLLKPRFQAGGEAAARGGIAVDLFVPVVGHVFQARVGNERRELVTDGEIVSNKRGTVDA